MTDQEKINEVLSFLTESQLDGDHTCSYDYVWVGSTLVVVTASFDGDIGLETYKKKDLVPWYNRAARYARDNKDDDPDLINEDGHLDSECYYETEPPKPKVSQAN